MTKQMLTRERFLSALDDGKSVDQIKRIYRGWEGLPLPQWQAWHTRTQPESISRNQVIDLLESGASPAQIAEEYRHEFSLPQLRAMKANVTMGKIRRDSVPELDRAQVIALLESGKSPAEVFEGQSQPFSIGQLRALKAHITMGTVRRE